MQLVVGIYPSSRDLEASAAGCRVSLHDLDDFVLIMGIFGHNKRTCDFMMQEIS